MHEVRLRIKAIDDSQRRLAEAALGRLADGPADFGVEAIDVEQPDDEATLTLRVGSEANEPCGAAVGALARAVLESQIELGIMWADPAGGHTDALETMHSVLNEQIDCEYLTP